MIWNLQTMGTVLLSMQSIQKLGAAALVEVVAICEDKAQALVE